MLCSLETGQDLCHDFMVRLISVKMEKDDDSQMIIGHSSFIKTIEDLYETMFSSVPGIKFGIAFSEASGPCLVRSEGNDNRLRKIAIKNILKIKAGHSFIIIFKNAYPINVTNGIKNIGEVTRIFCSTGNPVEVIIAKTKTGNSILGVVDGFSPKGVEDSAEVKKRRDFIREIGYKVK